MKKSPLLVEVRNLLDSLKSFNLNTRELIKFFSKTTSLSWVLSLLDVVSIFLLARFVQLGFDLSTGIKSKSATQLPLDLDNYLWTSPQEEMAILGGSFLLLFTLKSFLSIILAKKAAFTLAVYSSKLSEEITVRLFEDYGKLIRTKNTQEIISGVTATNSLIVTYLGSFFYLIADALSVATIFAAVLVFNPKVGLIAICFLFILGRVIHYYGGKKVLATSNQVATQEIDYANSLIGTLSIHKELLLSSKYNLRLRLLGDSRLSISNLKARLSFLPVLTRYLLEFAFMSLIVVVTATQIAFSTLESAVVTAAILMVAFIRVFPAFLRVQNQLLNMKQARGASVHTLELISLLGSKDPRNNHSPTHERFISSIEVENVSLDYSKESNDAWGLRDINLRISPGEFVAIVGKSGSGKSTLISVMLGFLIPSTGRVLISGEDPQEAVATWPGYISYVPQDIPVIDASIVENISFEGTEERDPEFIEEILRITAVKGLEESRQSQVYKSLGERGKTISGGEKQRIGIARALYTEPKIVFFDEATSSLDTTTEEEVSRTISSKLVGVTRVVVAHRLSTIRHADKVVYMDKGRIVAQGTFDELRKLVPDFENQAELSGISN